VCYRSLAAFLMAASVAGWCQPGSFKTGNSLLELSRSRDGSFPDGVCYGYITAIADAQSAGATHRAAEPASLSRLLPANKSMTSGYAS
jgi:hypothetical protein